MTNMFSGNQYKKVPKSLNECLTADPLSNNLWTWCQRIENYGKILFWILVVGGIIISIATAAYTAKAQTAPAEKYKSFYEDYDDDDDYDDYSLYAPNNENSFNTPIFFQSIIQWGIYAFLEYCTYHVLALLIGALASIVQNTKVHTDIALYNSVYGADTDNTGNSRSYEESETECALCHSKDNVKLCKIVSSTGIVCKRNVCEDCRRKYETGEFEGKCTPTE